MNIADLIAKVDGLIWGPPLMILLVGTGFYLTIRIGFIQFRGFRHGIKVLFNHFSKEDDPGE
ncbi:MAG: sodium:alanine symporter family protein, partial [Proteobacteria bacterium]|nr:sodium:alanine symporter family protein [Pseudomonadota bacterium]